MTGTVDVDVLVAGSGGLTHWVIDADFDRDFLQRLSDDPAGSPRHWPRPDVA